ncbi:MAG: hypothetical protein QOH08_2063 [Chloroflexota bacterium]|nr:hypothetical protein [Chloroflexota bacterium]
MRALVTVVASLALLVSGISLPSPSTAAAAGTYWFHGKPTDQADKAAAFADDTAVAGATFDQNPPTGLVPVTQTTTGVANQDFVGNPLTLYWHGGFSGAAVGQLNFDWWWTVPSPAGTSVSVTVFADPVYASPRGQPEKVIGRGIVTLGSAAAPTEMHGSVFVNGTVAHELLIQVAATSLITGNGIQVYYDATTTPSNFQFVAGTVPVPPAVVFDTTTSLAFAPSTTVSAHLFGAEPQTTLERRIAGSKPGRLDPNRIFVDWPLSSRTQSSQLSRSLDGGDSFRFLLDLTCSTRNRPQCALLGGGDSEDEVNLINGDLLFADQEGAVVNEGLASSTDHGDTWPLSRQFAVTNASSGVDRQWLAWADPSLVTVVKPLEAFFSYHVPLAGVYVLGVTVDGTPVDQPVPQILDVSQSGNLRVDNTHGPARGWVYVPYRNGGGYQVASAEATGYQLPTNWRSNLVTSDQPAIFPWLNLDARGNLYAVWVSGGIVYLAVSPIDDPRNDPTHGGRPATYWTPQVRVSLPAVGSAVFPAVTAGDPGRIAITYMGSTDCVGLSDSCPDTAHWNTYAAIITDALALARGTAPTVVSGTVSHRIDHRGQVCTSGTTCSGDRSLLDMIDLGMDQDGRVGVVFMDNNNGLAAEPRTNSAKNGPFTQFAKEVSGPSLLAPTGTRSGSIAVTIPQNGRTDPRGDATWPNTAAGTNLPALDLLGASVSTSGADLVARIPVADASRAGMARALAGYNAVTQVNLPADRLQYVFRFSTAENVFHLSMEYNSDGTIRFFGGAIDANDALINGQSILGAGYHTDPGYPVIGTARDGAITLRAPLAAFGLAVGAPITGANAFAMAGPAETIEKLIVDPMRTVDASPPFDATLGPRTQPPSHVDCRDENVQSSGGWHDLNDDRFGEGKLCRNVGMEKNGRESFQFTGTGLDVAVGTGPRGSALDITIDGTTQTVDLHRAASDPTHPDNGGTLDLQILNVHRDLPAGLHTAVISTRASSDPYRDMAYVDGFTVTGGDILTPVGHTVYEAVGTVIDTAVAGSDPVFALVVEPAAGSLDVVMEAIAGTTITIVDPSGKPLATATVDDGGVVDVAALTDGAGTYALVVHNASGGDLAFKLFESVAEAR